MNPDYNVEKNAMRVSMSKIISNNQDDSVLNTPFYQHDAADFPVDSGLNQSKLACSRSSTSVNHRNRLFNFNQWLRLTSNESKLDSNDNTKHMYAATANQLVYTYGRGKKMVNALNGITIKVPVGTIYGILGPSGCGKSTLVHCLVGSLKPKSGQVKVFGEVPGSSRSLIPGPGVGYMPQELGLFEEFTIKETLFFFGRLYRIPRETILLRIEFLISFLELPDKNCSVGKLSGGQKRRVSLAAALVHKPPLLVLDEPTVGIDPVLRQSIWSHLRSLTANEGITVIITTHYIDEAQYAQSVAFMRHGVMLEEGNPQELIQKFRLNNLEEVFLALCNNSAKAAENQKIEKHAVTEKTSLLLSAASKNENKEESDSDSAILSAIENQQQGDHKNQHENEKASQKLFSMGNVHSPSRAAAIGSQSLVNFDSPNKSIGSNVQQKRISFTTTNKPSSDSSHHISQRLLLKRNKVLDHFARSSALLNKNFIRMWRNLPVMLFTACLPFLQCILFFLCIGHDPYNIPVSVFNGEKNPQYSLEFLSSLDNHSLKISSTASFSEGLNDVLNGRSKALLSFGSNFSRANFERSIDLLAVDNDTLEMSRINLYVDMSSQFHASKIHEKVFDAYQKFSKKMLSENGLNPEIANNPIHIHSPVMGHENPTVTEFMAPGFIMSMAFFSSIATASLTLVLERKDGLLERSLVAGVYPNEYVISHVITQTVLVIFQTIAILLMSLLIFRMPNIGSMFWISVLIVMQGVWGLTYGIFISSITGEENFTLAICMGSMFPEFLLSGCVWPVETMPKFFFYISLVFSQAKPIDALRHMMYRGWNPLNHWDVTLGYLVSASWTVIYLFIAIILFNINKS